MSYCRFSDGDVYLYAHYKGHFECCACRLAPKVDTIFTKGGIFIGEQIGPCADCSGAGCASCQMSGNTEMPTAQGALDHLLAHVAAGHQVPDYAIERLRDELAELAADPIPSQDTK